MTQAANAPQAVFAEYVWIDGTQPTKELRSKTKTLKGAPPSTSFALGAQIPLDLFSEWGADGSSTNQAEGRDSDIVLRPVRAIHDPHREGGYLVLCEVFTGEGDLHSTNTRAELRRVLDLGAAREEPYIGFEQEYTLAKLDGSPLGFPVNGYPRPQGPYYCAVGARNITGRPFYEDFMQRTAAAGLSTTGFNWEVMPGQAEVQVAGEALLAADHIWLTRYVLHRTAEDHGVAVSIDAKPAKGDWNGAGMHTNFSTAKMRAPGGMAYITAACEAIGRNIEAHLAVYGYGYEERLTGAHETCSYREFKYGVADRTASIRIPRSVGDKGYGYLEDRRPNANADPYLVAARILRSVCNLQ
ncbi:MAG: glutamine synthetase [Deltaproteobacteria bacterium]|nr:glutamine synthetase [Deltaproteobacteria bacterium]